MLGHADPITSIELHHFVDAVMLERNLIVVQDAADGFDIFRHYDSVVEISLLKGLHLSCGFETY